MAGLAFTKKPAFYLHSRRVLYNTNKYQYNHRLKILPCIWIIAKPMYGSPINTIDRLKQSNLGNSGTWIAPLMLSLDSKADCSGSNGIWFPQYRPNLTGNNFARASWNHWPNDTFSYASLSFSLAIAANFRFLFHCCRGRFFYNGAVFQIIKHVFVMRLDLVYL
jgi:hypothetical protein